MNLPNKLTLTRLCLVPIMIIFYVVAWEIGQVWALWVSTAVYIIAAVTDFLDGKIARGTGCVTTLGKFLDPIADKVLTISALVMVLPYSIAIRLPSPYFVIGVIIIIIREFVVSGLRQSAASAGKVIAADMFGKIKAFVQDIAVPLIMMLPVLSSWWVGLTYLTWAVFGVSVILTILSGINYIWVNRSVFMSGDK